MKSLSMNIYINAWLDCSNPFISIHNKYNDDLLAHFNAVSINQLTEDGDIFIEDLQSTNPEIQMEVATHLIALKSSKRIKQQIIGLSTQLKKREPEPVIKIEINNLQKPKKPNIQITDLFPSSFLQSV